MEQVTYKNSCNVTKDINDFLASAVGTMTSSFGKT